MRDRTLENLMEEAPTVDELVGQGVPPDTARRLARHFMRTAYTLHSDGIPPDRQVFSCFVPGRIEVLGKHTDYAGGSSLLTALVRGFCFVGASGGPPGLFQITDAATGARMRVDIGGRSDGKRPGGWGMYPATAARRLARDFGSPARGGRLAFLSDLPSSAGLSSSSALLTGCALMVARVGGIEEQPAWRRVFTDREQLAGYLGAVENGSACDISPAAPGVGTRGGSGDHTAILCARTGAVVHYGYLPIRRQGHYPLPEPWRFVVASSGVRATKTGAARAVYNRASDRARHALQLWNRSEGRADLSLREALSSRPDALDHLRRLLIEATDDSVEGQALVHRIEHFALEEFELIPQAVQALEQADMGLLGGVMDASQQGAERLLDNQVPETGFLARSARRHGAVAASAFGAGFGGSVWALVPAAETDKFVETWRTHYTDNFPRHRGSARFLISGAGPPLLDVGSSTDYKEF